MNSATLDRISAFEEKYGLERLGILPITGSYHYRLVSDYTVDQALREFPYDNLVVFAERNQRIHGLAIPTDPDFEKQRRLTIRLETPPGRQAQVDFGQVEIAFTDGSRRRLWVFLLTLSYSRCVDCKTETRGCRIYHVLRRRPLLSDLTAILVGEELGF